MERLEIGMLVEYTGETVENGSVLIPKGRIFEIEDFDNSTVSVLPTDEDIKLKIVGHHTYVYRIRRDDIRICTDSLTIKNKKIKIGSLVRYIGQNGELNILYNDQIYKVVEVNSPSGQSYGLATTKVSPGRREATCYYVSKHKCVLVIPDDYIIAEELI